MLKPKKKIIKITKDYKKLVESRKNKTIEDKKITKTEEKYG